MKKIRVMLANHPEVIPDAVRKMVEAQADMEIVGDVRGPMRILQEVGRTKADAVILASTNPKAPGLCSQLLSVYPDLTIFAIGDDLQQGFVEQMCLRRSEVISAKGGDLIAALRQAVRSHCDSAGRQ